MCESCAAEGAGQSACCAPHPGWRPNCSRARSVAGERAARSRPAPWIWTTWQISRRAGRRKWRPQRTSATRETNAVSWSGLNIAVAPPRCFRVLLSLPLPPRSLDGRPAIASGLFSRVRSIQDPTKHKMARTTFALIAMHGAIASSLATPPSVVRLYDAASRRPVLLVGTMHYNPYSVSVVQGAIRAAARQHGLHAAAIELCPSRWNSTSAAQWRDKRFQRIPTYQRVLSEDEFQVAWEAAVDLGLSDVILADQPIALTGRQLGSALVCTLT